MTDKSKIPPLHVEHKSKLGRGLGGGRHQDRRAPVPVRIGVEHHTRRRWWSS